MSIPNKASPIGTKLVQKEKKNELVLFKCGPLKLYQSKSSVTHGENASTKRWGSDTCPTNSMNTPSEGILPPLSLNF